MLNGLSSIIKESRRIVFCGIGNSMRGDDAFGVIVAERLGRRIGSHRDVLVIDCGETPELFLDKIVDFKPDIVVFVDAVDFGGSIGDIVLVDPKSTLGDSVSTHNLPLKLLVEYLEGRLGSVEVFLIGIQPSVTGFLSKPSKKIVERAVWLSDYLFSLLFPGSPT